MALYNQLLASALFVVVVAAAVLSSHVADDGSGITFGSKVSTCCIARQCRSALTWDAHWVIAIVCKGPGISWTFHLCWYQSSRGDQYRICIPRTREGCVQCSGPPAGEGRAGEFRRILFFCTPAVLILVRKLPDRRLLGAVGGVVLDDPSATCAWKALPTSM